VVLLHGLASSFDHNWREAGWVDLLSEDGHDVLELDLPGHGHGPHETDPAAYSDLPALVDERIPRVADLDGVGFSLGGQILLHMAARWPARFRRIAVLGLGDGILVSAGRSPDALADAIVGDAEPAEHTARLFRRLTRMAGNDPAAIAAFVRRPAQRLDLELLGRITCPVLFIVGENDFTGPPDQLAAAAPRARQLVLSDTDHFGLTMDYRCVNEVLDFLKA
jgi:pimeloyl-ACP methyl ester carboxylesterase